MTDRVETVRLTANVANYLAGMEAARVGTTKVVDTLAKQKAAAAAAAEAQGAASTKIGIGFLAIGAVAAASVLIAVKAFADFEAKMSQVQALSHATGGEMKILSDQALHLGQSIGVTANQVADAEIELVKAGISVSNIMGGALKGSLDLAAAGQIDVADATEIATIAMTQFKLKGQDIPHVADLLAAGADKALGGVQDLGEALKSGGLVAAQFGLSLDDTVGVLSAFANAGLLGETAGTDLRQMLLKLAAPSAQSAAAMQKLGISVYDSSGQFVGAVGLAGQLKDKMSDLDPATRNAALATIFGSRAIAGANVLYKEGAAGIQDWIDKVDDSGFAAKQAAAKMDNLNGDINKLGAAFQTDLIESGSNANGILRGMTQDVTGVVKAIGSLPAPVLAVGIGVTALVAGVTLLGGGFLVLVPRIAATKLAMADLNISGKSLATGFGKGGGVLLALSALTSAFTNTGSSAELSADKLAQVDAVAQNLTTHGLDSLFSNTAVGIASSATSAGKLKEALNESFTGDFFNNRSAALKFVDGLTFGMTHLSDAAKTNEAQFKELGHQLSVTSETNVKAATTQFNEYVKAAGGGKEAIRQLLQAMPDYAAKLRALAADQGVTLTQTQLFNLATGKGALAQEIMRDSAAKLAQSVAGVGQAAQDASGDISALEDSITNFNKVQFTADDAVSALDQSIVNITTAIGTKGFSGTLDQSTQAGIDNNKMLRDLAQKTNDAAAKTLDLTGNVDDANGVLQRGRDQLAKLGGAFGLSGDALQTFIDTYIESPKDLTFNAGLSGLTDAQQQINAFIALNNGRVLSINVRSQLPDLNGSQSGTGRGGTYAKGGYTKPGPHIALVGEEGTEFVSTAKTVANPSNRAALEYMHAGGVIPGYAGGGYTSPQYAPQAPYMQAPASTSGRVAPIINLSFQTLDPAVAAELAMQQIGARVKVK